MGIRTTKLRRMAKENPHWIAACALALATACQLGIDVPMLVRYIVSGEVARMSHAQPTETPAATPSHIE